MSRIDKVRILPQKYEFYKEAKDWVSIIWKCTHLLTYSIFICVKWLRSSASSTLGSLGASVIFLHGIPKVWEGTCYGRHCWSHRNGVGWGGIFENSSLRNKQTHPELEPQLAVGLGLPKANCQQQLEVVLSFLFHMMLSWGCSSRGWACLAVVCKVSISCGIGAGCQHTGAAHP